MNFENMPELKMKYAYFAVIGIMFIIAILLIIYFIRKGWLQKSDYHIPKDEH